MALEYFFHYSLQFIKQAHNWVVDIFIHTTYVNGVKTLGKTWVK